MIYSINLSAVPDNLNLEKRKKILKKKPIIKKHVPSLIETPLEFPESQKLKRPKYVFSKNNWTFDHETALETLLENYFPSIYNLKNVSREGFKHGQIGAQFLPNVITSKIPNIVEFEKLERFNDKVTELKVLCEKTEKDVLNGIKEYFQVHPKEDAVIFVGQEIEYDYKEWNGLYNRKYYEKDFLILNLTYGYALNIEVKNHLGKGEVLSGCKQLEETKRLFRHQFGDKIDPNWRIILVLYGSTLHLDLVICRECQPYVITSEDDFTKKLESITRMNAKTSWKSKWVHDFRFIIKELIPPRVKLPDELIKEVIDNVDKAGSAENIAFWSPEQFQLASFCAKNKRVIFTSSYSTGKTVLLIHCALELLKKGQKVLFVIFGNNASKSLLQMKLERLFEEFDQIIVKSTKNLENWNWLKSYQDYHVFVDELVLGVPDIETTENDILEMNELISPVKHLWIAIAGNISLVDESRLSTKFQFPKLTYPLRNTQEIVEFTKKVAESSLNPQSHFGSLPIKIDVQLNYEMPSNLTTAYQPNVIKSHKNPKLGIFQAFKNIPLGKVALIVIDIHDDKKFNDIYLETREFAAKETKRPRPICYTYFNHLENDPEEQIKDWVVNAKTRKRDLITQDSFIDGFESDVVLVIEDSQQSSNLNCYMRCISFLIVVKV